MRNPVLRKRVHQGDSDVILTDDVGEALRTIFAGEYLIGHAQTSIVPPWHEWPSAAVRTLFLRCLSLLQSLATLHLILAEHGAAASGGTAVAVL